LKSNTSSVNILISDSIHNTCYGLQHVNNRIYRIDTSTYVHMHAHTHTSVPTHARTHHSSTQLICFLGTCNHLLIHYSAQYLLNNERYLQI